MSRRLFASAFTVPLLPTEEKASVSYDEDRSLNVDSHGVPVVEREQVAQNGTITEVRGEASDRDNAATFGTVTRASGEAADRMPTLGTQTMLQGESSDYQSISASRVPTGNSAVLLGTRTAAPGEPTDPPHAREAMRIDCLSARPATRRVVR